MARFWGKAIYGTLHKVTDHKAVLRSAKGVGRHPAVPPDTRREDRCGNRVDLDLRRYPV